MRVRDGAMAETLYPGIVRVKNSPTPSPSPHLLTCLELVEHFDDGTLVAIAM
jgi:hypothetical protein